ncbi:MAG: hypothetical protein LLG44_08670 [Chloroflexi bacterium]|nr:hypothetical protein [Chloroflexota bacterium]
MQSNEVINQLIARFETLFPRFIFKSLRKLPPPQRGDMPYHLLLRITPQSGTEIELGCLVLTTGYQDEVERAVHRLTKWLASENNAGLVPALLAPYLAPAERELIRQNALAYLDLEGNVNLNVPGMLVYVDKDTARPQSEFERVILPFEGKAERVARRLLLGPAKTWNMRELAAVCGISLGMASMVTTALADLGAVAKSRKGITLFDAPALLDAWVKSYRINRNPFQVLRGTTAGLSVQDLVNINSADWALTLWSGATALLGETLPSERMAFYWMGGIDRLVERLHLSRDKGDMMILVFQPTDASLMWEPYEFMGGIRVVNPLQLYLDLASGDEEELELARRIRDKYLSC